MKFLLDLNDRRLPFVEKELKALGYNTMPFSQENFAKLKKGDYIVLSPAYKWSVELSQKLPQNISIVCGAVSPEVKDIFDNKNIKYFNLMDDEDFVLRNAMITAEGALADLIFYTKKSIFECNILILGSGRCAKAMAYLLYKLGVKFDLTMRDAFKLKQSQLLCNKALDWADYKNNLKEYDVVINTIPTKLFEEEDLQKFKEGSVVLELASKQCLQDLKAEKFSYILCPALPSKYTPQSAGNLIFNYLQTLLKGD